MSPQSEELRLCVDCFLELLMLSQTFIFHTLDSSHAMDMQFQKDEDQKGFRRVSPFGVEMDQTGYSN